MCDKLNISTYEGDMYNAIRYTKTQQWLIAYYGLLVQGAIIGGFKLFEQRIIDLGLYFKSEALFVLAIVFLSTAIYMIYVFSKMLRNYQNDLDEYRDRVEHIRKIFKYPAIVGKLEDKPYIFNNLDDDFYKEYNYVKTNDVVFQPPHNVRLLTWLPVHE